VGDLKDCTVDSAGKSTFDKTITYSETPDFGNPQVVDITNTHINALAPNQQAEVADKIGFVVDGYYLISSVVDAENEVNERDENNNDNEHDFSPNFVGRDTRNIIRITGANKRPQTGANGEKVYIQKISTLVTYKY